MPGQSIEVQSVGIRSVSCFFFEITYKCPGCGGSFAEEERFSVEWDRDVACPHCGNSYQRRQEDLLAAYRRGRSIPSYEERIAIDRLAYSAVSARDSYEGASLVVEGVDILPLLGKSLAAILMDDLLAQLGRRAEHE